LLALELALQLEAEGREGKLYLVDSAPDFAKAMLTEIMGSKEDEFETRFISTLLTLIALHDGTSAAVTKVYHERNGKFYQYWNALSLCICPFKICCTHSQMGLFPFKFSILLLVLLSLCCSLVHLEAKVCM
jgi:hypothetical protein